MTKSRSRVADYLVYLAVRVVVCVLQILSLEQGKRLARGLAWLLHRLDRRHRLVALDNLQHAFGDELSEGARADMVRAVYVHFCTMLVEMVQLPRLMHVTTWHRYLSRSMNGKLLEAFLTCRPTLIVTGHFGNWEMSGYALALFGFETYAIARTLDNPYLDRFLRQFREKTGQHILAKHGEFERIQEVLAKGGILATLGDQDAGQRGQFVPFFGRPASTHKAVALLALQYNVQLVVVCMPRIGSPPQYHIVVEEFIDPQEYAGRRDAVAALTERFTAALERLIRLAPEQYFWLHRRWKHQPKERKVRQAA